MRVRCFALLAALTALSASAAPVDPQPFLADLPILLENARVAGSPFSEAETAALLACVEGQDTAAVERAQKILDAHVLFIVTVNPEQRVKATLGEAKRELVQGGWRQMLVKVINEAGTTAPLRIMSGEALPVFERRRGEATPSPVAPKPPLPSRWLDLLWRDLRGSATLSGLGVEYRFLSLYSRDAGKRRAQFQFDVGAETKDLGARSELNVLFGCLPSRDVTLRIVDENGDPCTAALTITDGNYLVYPSRIKRVAPDFDFQQQVYRADGEKLGLPDGKYQFAFQRGPESLKQNQTVEIGPETKEIRFQVRRWIDPAKFGWWSGDHHIHAAGCAHYTSPTEGVLPADMARHCQGEDLKVGASLTWGPGFDYQKQFFTGREDANSHPPYLLRYDIEVSGFGSHKSGHLCLLRLRDQMYPGGESSAHWPTLGLNTLRWAQKQGAVCGPAHSGWGLGVASEQLPNYELPSFDSIGANEYIVDVTHEVEGPDGKPVPAVDFMSTVDTPPTWELNMWYHTLNAGFRTRISGETDFPCIYDERVGLGRSYVKVDGPLTYDAWCEGIAQGRCYVSDGRSHLLDFTANGLELGQKGSELRLPQPGVVQMTVKAAALLLSPAPASSFFAPPSDVRMPPNLAAQRGDRRFVADYQRPYWNLDRARIGKSGNVPVELIVNGQPVARKVIAADGKLNDLTFEFPIEQSSWVALRILPSSHTNPFFVLVGDKPVRASKKSIAWCLAGVDQCWSQKERTYADGEKEEARAAYEHARTEYRSRLAEATVD